MDRGGAGDVNSVRCTGGEKAVLPKHGARLQGVGDLCRGPWGATGGDRGALVAGKTRNAVTESGARVSN
jgi:hypothetical protein